MSVHESQRANGRPGLHGCRVYERPVSAERPPTWSERPDAHAARIARKRAVRAALVERGESKIDYLAAVLGVSRSYVARCLSEAHRDEFNDHHLAQLGLGRAA